MGGSTVFFCSPSPSRNNYKWVPIQCWDNLKEKVEEWACYGLASHPGVAAVIKASSCGNQSV